MSSPADGVNPRAGKEQGRTRQARAAVVDAARTLFLEHGYPATTIETISERSGVPQATVYRLFAGKLGVLKAVLDTSIGGDDQAVRVHERPEVTALLAAPDADTLFAGLAAVTAAINERTGEMYRVLASAAAQDPAAAQLFAEVQQQRAQGQRRVARAAARHGVLRTGLRERDAADVVHALASPEVYRLLVVDRRWSTRRYRDWLAATLVQQLT